MKAEDYDKEKLLKDAPLALLRNKYLILSIVGLILFIILAATLPFKDRLFSRLYPKSPSSASQEEDWKDYDQLVQKGRIKQSEQVIYIHLSYNVQDSPQVTIKNAKKRKGYSSPYPATDNGYVLQLLDNQNNILHSLSFDIPDKVASDGVRESGKNTPFIGGIETAKEVELLFALPGYENASQIKLLNPNKKVIDTEDLAKVPSEENKPSFRSITGDEFLKIPKDKLLNLETILAKDAYAASTDNSFVDFVFIGDNYSDLNVFYNDVNRFIADFLTHEPFQSQSERMRFHTVDNTSSLDCGFSYQTGSGRLDCNTDLIYQKVGAAGVPYDNIYIIVNRNSGSGLAGKGLINGGIAYGITGPLGPQVFAHESSHSFGGLLDEYVAYASDGTIDNKSHVNCYAGTPPATGVTDWQQDSVTAGDYRLGCSYPNWYASSQNSLMNIIDGNKPDGFYFNNVSRRYLNQKINFFASQPVPPSPNSSTPGSAGCQCNYYQSCTKTNGTQGVQSCNGAYGGTSGNTNVCEWDQSGSCSASCQDCTCDCAYSQACTTADGKNGTQTCSGAYGGTTGNAAFCEWDAGGACAPNCSECKTDAGSIILPSPTPGAWQACGSCAVGCGGDPNKSHCFSGTNDMGCQSAYQCQLAPDNTCQWNPGSCTNSGANMTCLECVFNMARFCEPKTSLITWESPSENVCSNQWEAYSWGPKARIIQQNLNDCEYMREQGWGCGGNWGYASVGLKNCICGDSTADTNITFSNNNPQAGQKFTVYVKSFKNYDQGSGSGAAKDPMIVKMAAFDSQGKRIDLGTPIRSSIKNISSYNQGNCQADTWTGSGDGSAWPQRVYEWDVSLPSASTYSFQFSVQEIYHVCATASLAVVPAPTPIPAPAAPKVTPNVSCVNGPYSGNELTVAWNNPTGAPVTWIDISPNLYFNAYWNKSASSLTSTTAPAGFSNAPSLLPNIPYYIRLYNGLHSPISSFILFSCPTPTPTPAPIAGSGIGLTGTYYDNMDYTGPSISRSDPTINFNWRLNSPHAIIGSDTFSVRWIGEVQPQYSQNYTFYTLSDDGVRVWVNNQLIINNWTDHGATENSGTISLTAGQKYPIKVEFYENSTDARMELYWSSASQIKQIIPSSQLYPATPSSTSPPTQNYGAISGTAYSSAGGIVAGAKIITKVGKTNKTYYSNSMGVYFINNLPPGTYTLNFSAKGYFNKSMSILVNTGSTTSGNVTLTKK